MVTFPTLPCRPAECGCNSSSSYRKCVPTPRVRFPVAPGTSRSRVLQLLFRPVLLTVVSPLICIIFFDILVRCQYFSLILSNRNGMFKVRRRPAVRGPDGPSIRFLNYLSCSQVDHRFNSDNHPFGQFGTLTTFTVVGNLGVFVKALPDAVTNQLPYHTVAKLLHVALDGKTDVTHSLPCFGLPYTEVEGFQCALQELERFRRSTFQRIGIGRVAVVALIKDATINRDNVAFLQFVVSRKPMHHDIINRNAKGGWEPIVILERR